MECPSWKKLTIELHPGGHCSEFYWPYCGLPDILRGCQSSNQHLGSYLLQRTCLPRLSYSRHRNGNRRISSHQCRLVEDECGWRLLGIAQPFHHDGSEYDRFGASRNATLAMRMDPDRDAHTAVYQVIKVWYSSQKGKRSLLLCLEEQRLKP